MTDQDIIFKILTNKELATAAPESFSYIGWEGTESSAFYLFAENYHDAAQTLYDKMVSVGRNNAILDGLIYPLIFTHRHFCELMLKGIYFEFSGETEETLKKFLKNSGHDLMRIWKEARPLLSSGKRHVGSKVNLGAVEHYLNQLNSYDPDSMAMRYPVTKNLVKMRDRSKHLDFHNLHARMLELHHALNQIRYDISNQVTINYTDQEIDSFDAAVDASLPKLLELLAILKPLSDEEFKKDFKITSLFGDNIDDMEEPIPRRKDLDFIYGNDDDFLILVETLYYSARHVAERLVTLSMNPEEKKKEFICVCLDHMRHHNLEFGKTPSVHSINIHCKGASAIYNELSLALELLGKIL